MPALETLFARTPCFGMTTKNVLPVPPLDPCWHIGDNHLGGISITSSKCYPSSGFVYFKGLGSQSVHESEWREFTSHIQRLARWDGIEADRVERKIIILSLIALCTGVVWIPYIRQYYLQRRTQQECCNLYSRNVRMLDGSSKTLNDIMTEYNDTYFKMRNLYVRLYVPSFPTLHEGPEHRVSLIIHQLRAEEVAAPAVSKETEEPRPNEGISPLGAGTEEGLSASSSTLKSKAHSAAQRPGGNSKMQMRKKGEIPPERRDSFADVTSDR